MRLITLFILLLTIFHGTSVRAQERPKVGLVLSGGGAKGYAHIGALRVIEEAGIEVDYIGGTSMGAIVGGLYAAGYSADQLEQLLRSIDIMAELQDAVEREDRTIYEKLNNGKYLISLNMREFSLQLPTALSDGQRVHDLFAHWTAGVGHVRDFSKLPVPFLCVATDVETGDEVVLERGMLAEAMRASAALPGVLSPFMIDGRLLTDGGVSNNYPAEEIRGKDMDYIIGISVESNPLKADDIQSLGDLMTQIAFFQANRRILEQYEATDLDIRPELDGFNVLSFADIDTLIQAGATAAEAMRPELDSLAALQSPPKSRRDTTPPVLPDSLNVRLLSIAGSRELSDRQVLSFFNDKLPGRISWKKFREGLTALHVTGRYANINYQWERTGQGDAVDMALTFEPQPSFGQQVRLGLHYDQVYRSNLLLNLTTYDLIVDNSLASLDLLVGNRLRYRFDYRVGRVNGTAFGLRSRFDYVDVNFNLPRRVELPLGVVIDELEYRFNDLALEPYWDFWQTPNSLTGLAAELKYFSTDAQQVAAVDSASAFALVDQLYFVPKLYLIYDKLDAVGYPMRGFRLDANARVIRRLTGVDQEWTYNLDLDFRGMLPLGEKQSLGLNLSTGTTFDRASLPYRYYLGSNSPVLLNNFKPFPSLDVGEAAGSHLFMAHLFVRYRPFFRHYVHLGGRAAWLDNPEGLPSSIDGSGLFAGSVGYGFDSPLGPIELMYAYGTAGGGVYFNLGHWF